MTSTMQPVRPYTQEMVIVHRVFRREFGLLPRLVAATRPGDVRRARRLVAHLEELLDGLHHHHAGEDELLWPLILRRATLHADLVRRMEHQHERVGGLILEARGLAAHWAVSADAVSAGRLADAVARLAEALAEHLDEEERHVLPLAAEHLTVEEWEALGERGRAGTPKSRRMTLLGALLEEATPAETAVFMRRLPPPARLLWRLVGRRRYARETAEIRG
jgi:hemerythrin-like domain-containing protein